MSSESPRSVRISYDEDTDVAYIRIAAGDPMVHRSVHLNNENVPGEVIVDLDSLNRIVGFEIIGAASSLPPDFLLDSNVISFFRR
jgi:uncharacterized protein YuzE